MSKFLPRHGRLLLAADQQAVVGSLPVLVDPSQRIPVGWDSRSEGSRTCAWARPRQTGRLLHRLGSPDHVPHPALERVVGVHMHLLAHAGIAGEIPDLHALLRADKCRVETLLCQHAPRLWKRRNPEVFADLDQQALIDSGHRRHRGPAGLVSAIGTAPFMGSLLTWFAGLTLTYPLHKYAYHGQCKDRRILHFEPRIMHLCHPPLRSRKLPSSLTERSFNAGKTQLPKG